MVKSRDTTVDQAAKCPACDGYPVEPLYTFGFPGAITPENPNVYEMALGKLAGIAR